MSQIEVTQKIGHLDFKWGKRRGVGLNDKGIHFYESFTYDGIHYSLYDCVYLQAKEEIEPYIGKLVKIWEKPDKSKKVKVHWFFHPFEFSYYLGDEEVLQNEIFLASGKGDGVTDICTLESICGKCNVVCISKDKRNRQPTEEELEFADHVFGRTFDVANFRISSDIGDKVSELEVNFFFNRPNNESGSVEKLNFKMEDNLTGISGSSTKMNSVSKMDPNEMGITIADSKIMSKIQPSMQDIDSKGKLDTTITDADKDEILDGGFDAMDVRPSKKAKIEDKASSQPNSVGVSTSLVPVTGSLGRKVTSVSEKKNSDSKIMSEKKNDDSKIMSKTQPSMQEVDSKRKPETAITVADKEDKLDGGFGAMDVRPSKKARVEDKTSILPNTVGVSKSLVPATGSFSRKVTSVSEKKIADSTIMSKSKPSMPDIDSNCKLDTAITVADKEVTLDGSFDAMDVRSSKKARVEDKASSSPNSVGVSKSLVSATGSFSKKVTSVSEKKIADNKIMSKSQPSMSDVDSKRNLDTAITVTDKETTLDGSFGVMDVRPSKKAMIEDKASSPPNSVGVSKSLVRDSGSFSRKVTSVPEKKIELKELQLTSKPNDDERSKWFRPIPWLERMKEAHENGTLVMLFNLDPEFTSKEVEDIIWQAFKEKCSAKMVQRTTISNPYFGQAFIILRKRETTWKIIEQLRDGCLMLSNGRVLTGSIVPARTLPAKQSTFAGHMVLDRVKSFSKKVVKEAVTTSHCSQPNTIEFDMAMEWRLLQARSDYWWKRLYKEQEEEIKKVKASLTL